MTKNVLLILLLLGLSLSGIAQTRQLKGEVKDGISKEKLPGVSVLVKGTRSGTTSDADGKFTLDIPVEGSSVVISYVGFINQTIDIGNRTFLEITLEPDVKALDDVVVIGYGEQKR